MSAELNVEIDYFKIDLNPYAIGNFNSKPKSFHIFPLQMASLARSVWINAEFK